MKPWMKFTLALIPVLVTAVVTILTAAQGQSNKVAALRAHDNRWQEHRDRERHNIGEFDKGMKTDMAALRESAEVATKDTGVALVQPTTLGKVLGQKAKPVAVKSLRGRARPAKADKR
jgi:hypothetical protein